MISVLLVDDQALVRSGFKLIIDAQDDMEVVGEAADGRAAIDETARLHPDIVLMDVRMPEVDGIAATRSIVGERPEARVLVLTTFDEDRTVYDAMQARADSCSSRRRRRSSSRPCAQSRRAKRSSRRA